MLKNKLLFPFALLVTIVFMWSIIQKPQLQYESFEGYITEDADFDKKFYIQDYESGAVIELKFINEDTDLLSFAEFGKVLVFGHYNVNDNYLIVNEIISQRTSEMASLTYN